MSDRVKILIADGTNYEDLFAEVRIDGDTVLVINQENGEFEVEMDQSWIWSEGRKEIPLAEFKLASSVLRRA